MNTLKPDRTLQAYSANRSKYPAKELLQYCGLWVAWNPEGTEVLTSAPDRKELRRRICELGKDPHLCVAERIP